MGNSVPESSLRGYPWWATALGVVAGVAADRLIPDPATHHPVAYFGNYAAWLEKKLYRPTRTAGAAYLFAAVVPPTAIAAAAYRKYPFLSTAVALWAAMGGTSLAKVGTRMATALERDEEEARTWVPWLCSRDPQALDGPAMARATVESIAENTSDAAIAPLVWALAGAPGIVAHRAINTLDAMVGYKNSRYQNFGWAAAKIDDVAAYLPARLTAAIHLALAAGQGRGPAACLAWRTQAPNHPSPNAGPVEATAAAALGVTLGGPTQYAWGVEQRPTLGAGPAPSIDTIGQAVRLSTQTTYIAAGIVLAVLLAGGRRARS